MLFLKTITNKKEEVIIFPFKKQIYSKKLIAVGSVAHGLGTTHIALTFANYICSKLGMKTAYIELNTTNQIHALCTKSKKPSFVYKGIVFYPNTSVTSLSGILHEDFQYFILDMGILNTYNISEFLRCDKSFLVCGLGTWRQLHVKEKLETLFKNQHHQNCTVIMNLCEKESNFFYFLKPCKHVPFPFLQNPFQLETKKFHAIYRILKM